jgi:hypothetical protein
MVWYKWRLKIKHDRLGEHPGLVREEEFRSGMISDAIEISSNDEIEKSDASDDGFRTDRSDNSAKKTIKKKPTSRKVTATATMNKGKPISCKGVPAPRHKRQVSQNNISGQAVDFFASNAEYLKATTNADNKRLKLLKRRETREDKQHGFMMDKGKAEVKLAETETKVRNAREVLMIDGMPDEVKAAARQVLIDYFTTGSQ